MPSTKLVSRSKEANATLALAFAPVLGYIAEDVLKLAAGLNLAGAKQHFGNAISILKTAPAPKPTSMAPIGGVGGSLKSMLQARKVAGLGTAASKPDMVGKFKGMMSTNALKTPGYAASTQAINPRKSIISAMNTGKPH